MNSKIVAFIALIAVLLGCVVSAEVQSIKLHLNEGSSQWWIAVDPRDDLYDTVKVELREAGDSKWHPAQFNPGWPYFALPSTSGRGFALPLTLRLTADNGQQVVATISRISGGALVDTNLQYGTPSETATQAPATQTPTTTPAATQTPSTAPTSRPPTAPTTRPVTTEAPATVKPTQAPATQAPATQAPATQAPATQAPATVKPTQPATQAPVTQAPTKAATQAPTQPATQAPTRPATQAPTQAPATQPPTKAATQAPTQPASSVDACSIVPTRTEPVKILVPLYVYPGAAWDSLITAANNGAKIIAIINPNSGPNSAGPDAAYTSYMKKFKDAGIEMVGYVHTSWGARDITTVNSEIGTYASKYAGVTGIFFDEASVESKDVAYYRQAYNTVLAKNFVHSILNPGVQPDKQYLDISTNIVIFENYASDLANARFDSWVKCAPSSSQKTGYQYKFSAIIHTASLSQMPSLIATAHNMGMGLVYVTDGPGGCCTYNTLTSYFSAQATSVKQLNLA